MNELQQLPPERLSQEIDNRLASMDPTPFSEVAFDAYKTKVARYMSELFDESIKMSRRQDADVVSAAHVDRASEYLVSSSRSRVARHVGTFGGVFLGAGVSQILAMAAVSQFTVVGTLLGSMFCVVGAFAVAYHVAKE
jgi:hypothetical protein